MSYAVDIAQKSIELGRVLQAKNWSMAAAESCTGGWLAKSVTDVAGSSAWFDRGFVTYSNLSKQEMLGVLRETLQQYGAVSEATVREMALGALRHSQADCSVAISGIAGPGGATTEKPVGLVWLAWGLRDGMVQAHSFHFAGDRESVRAQAVLAGMEGLLGMLQRFSNADC